MGNENVVKRYAQRGVSLTVWNNSGRVSFSFQKTYKKKDETEYKTTTVYFDSDLRILEGLIKEALIDYGTLKTNKATVTVPENKVSAIAGLDNDDIPF